MSIAHRFFKKFTLIGVGARLMLAGATLFSLGYSLQYAVAKGDTRTLSFHHLHTGENITVTFKRNGRYDEAAVKKLDWFMRDWRKQEAIQMDRQLFDLLWEAYTEGGATQPIQVVCGYRSPATNAMLRARSSGVAKFSQHTLGHAMDFFIPGIPLEKIREIGLRLQRGGVGFYPTSGSPFVHLDTGSVRHWPRMTYAQLAKVFPDGHTVHVAADGRTLPHYAEALADLRRRGKTPNANSLVAARAKGVITASEERQTEMVAGSSHAPKRSLLASLFDSTPNANTDEREDETPAASSASKHERKAEPKPAPRQPRPRIAVATTAPKQKQMKQPIVTASIGAHALDSRRTQSEKGLSSHGVLGPPNLPFVMAGAESSAIGSSSQALSYVAITAPDVTNRLSPMGDSLPHIARETRSLPENNSLTVTSKAPLTPPTGMDRLTDSWIRAVMLTPSISHFMTATLTNRMDLRTLNPLLVKPSQLVMMTFSADPDLLTAERFTGPAVVFVATTSFTQQKTASLQ